MISEDSMKKALILLICTCLTFSLSGCSLGDLIERFSPREKTQEEVSSTPKTRVYMDEISGTLVDFDGSTITMTSDDGKTYLFDVSQATLECEVGLISGDKISVIYEGRLSDDTTDTSMVKALKVADEFHKDVQLEERTAYVQITAITSNTISVRSKKGKTATYPISGVEQYYQNGVQTGNWVYIHFKGTFPPAESSTDSLSMDGSHIKVLSISDIDPLVVPTPTPTPAAGTQAEEHTPENILHAEIQNMNGNLLTVIPDGKTAVLNIDLSAVQTYLAGGSAPGSYVNLFYEGEWNGTTLEGITITRVCSDDSGVSGSRHVTATITGTVIGTTSNTVTIQTAEGAEIICDTQGAENLSSQGLEPGNSIRITFDPDESRESNIYQCLKIEDA